MDKIVAMISLGCAKNRVNSEQMMYLLRDAGYNVTGETCGADVVVVNTCGFIESAKLEAIDTILELAEEKAAGNIGAIIAAGCLPERYKNDILTELPELDAVLGTGSFDDIAQAVSNVLGKTGQLSYYGDIDTPPSEAARIISTSSVWAYLKIAEGCDNRCAYCCIPSIRGRYRSRPIKAIVNEAQKFADNGYKELILVAQDTTAYGTDLYGRRSLAPLLRELGKIDNLTWIRLLYMYPDGFDNELIDEIANNDKIVKYLDIPVQHINDKILQSMNRRGTSAEIRSLLHNLKSRIPGLVLRTSVITGLPGEGEREFDELCAFLREAEIQRAGVFPYSPEEGTAAALMEHPGTETAQLRAGIVQEIQAQIMARFNEKRVGSVENVLIDNPCGERGPVLPARSYAEAPEVDGYIKVKAAHPVAGRAQQNSFVKVKLTGIADGELTGEAV